MDVVISFMLKETGIIDLFGLLDEQTERLRPFFQKRHGKPRVNDRRVLNGIVFVNRYGRAGAQLRQTYTEHGAEIITGQTASQVLMAVGDTATAKWGVDLLGTVEVETQRPTDTLGSDQDGRGSLAITRERKTLVIDAELMNLAVGQAYLRLSGRPLALVTIDPPQDMPAIAPDFIPAAPAIGEAAVPATFSSVRASRIEDDDNWLTTGGPF